MVSLLSRWLLACFLSFATSSFYSSFFSANPNSLTTDGTPTGDTSTNEAEEVYSFKNLNFTAATSSLENLIHLITYRFNLDNKYRAQVFDVAANMNTNSWDIIKVTLNM